MNNTNSRKAIFEALLAPTSAPGLSPFASGKIDMLARLYADEPLVMPGTSIGAFAVNDITNRMMARGATPRYLSATFLVAPQLSEQRLRYVATNMAEAAVQAEVEIISVDTVVSDSLAGDMALTLSAVGEPWPQTPRSPECAHAGDAIILTGAVGAHGVAIAESRGNFIYLPPVLSDTAALTDVVRAIRDEAAERLVALFYPAQGLDSAIAEIKASTGLDAVIDSAVVPVGKTVGLAAKIMGKRPVQLATAAAMIAIVPAEVADKTIAAVRRSAYGAQAAIIGRLQ